MREYIAALRAELNAAKPNDRSDTDRRIAIVLTDLEKLEALILAWNIEPWSAAPATDLGHRPPIEDLDDAPAENTAAGVITETEPATEQ